MSKGNKYSFEDLVEKTTKLTVGIPKPFKVDWFDPEIGFGEFWFYNKDGKIHCDNECMSAKYVEKIMKTLVAQSVMRDREPCNKVKADSNAGKTLEGMMGKARKLKKLRRVAEALTQGTEIELQIRLRKKLVGEDPEGKKIYKTLAGTVRHAAGTTREVYQKLKTQG